LAGVKVVVDVVSIFIGALVPLGVALRGGVEVCAGSAALLSGAHGELKVIAVFFQTTNDSICHCGLRVGPANKHGVSAQVLDKSNHHDQQRHAKRQRVQDGQVLKTGYDVFATGEQHDNGDAHHTQAPE